MNQGIGALHRAFSNRVDSAVPQQRTPAAGRGGFLDALKERMDSDAPKLKLSKHAEDRLHDRNIELSDNDMNRLGRAAEKAAAKGARMGLMMMGNVNLIVSLQNRTVVTAMAPESEGDVMYTNIDSAVMVGEGQETM